MSDTKHSIKEEKHF